MRTHYGITQYEARDLIKKVKRFWPKDAFAVIGLVTTDLAEKDPEPDEDQWFEITYKYEIRETYVEGIADFDCVKKTAVQSVGRYLPDFRSCSDRYIL